MTATTNAAHGFIGLECRFSEQVRTGAIKRQRGVWPFRWMESAGVYEERHQRGTIVGAQDTRGWQGWYLSIVRPDGTVAHRYDTDVTIYREASS